MGLNALRTLRLGSTLVLVASCAQTQAVGSNHTTVPAKGEVCQSPVEPRVAFDAGSREAFAAWIHGELDHLAPCWTFRRGDDGELSFVGSYGERTITQSFQSGWRHCQNVPAQCEPQVRAVLADVQHMLQTYDDAPTNDAAQLRPVVRDSDFAAALALNVPGAVVERLAGDLYLLLALDRPATLAFVGSTELEEVALDRIAARERALQNLRSELAVPLAEIDAIQPGVTGQLTPHYYTSSLLALHDAWAAAAARLEGQLFVAVPSPEVLFHGDLRDPQGVETVRGLASKIYDEAPQSISRDLLRWTPDGWVVVPVAAPR
jgi:uncharacterized protein YtpQ (UPF0354 family)